MSDDRRWGYRLTDGEVESKIFEGKLPSGWHDSPAKCVKRKKAKADDDDK